MVVIACGTRVLFLFTPSSIILVCLTLRLHFVAHYRGRGDGPKEELLQKILQRTGEKEQMRAAGLVAISGLPLKLSSLLAVQFNFISYRTGNSVFVFA